MEIWKDIKGYEGIYQVSNYGRVKNSKFGNIRKLVKDKKGYLRVGLNINGTQKHYFVHRLVAEVFIPNPHRFPQINHIDENKKNNYYQNLEWCSNFYNCNYGEHSQKISISHSKQVFQYNKNLMLVDVWLNTREPEKYGFNHAHVASCCRNERKTHRGYIWSYSPIYDLLKQNQILPVIEQKCLA